MGLVSGLAIAVLAIFTSFIKVIKFWRNVIVLESVCNCVVNTGWDVEGNIVVEGGVIIVVDGGSGGGGGGVGVIGFVPIKVGFGGDDNVADIDDGFMEKNCARL